MSKEINDALKHLMEEFNSAEELEKVINKVAKNEKPGIPETRQLAEIVYSFRHLAHSEKEVAHDEDAIELLLAKMPGTEGFLEELKVAAGHLKAIAAYHDGELGRHLAAWQHALNDNKDAEPSPAMLDLVEQEWEGFRKSAEELFAWIKTNAALLTRLRDSLKE